MTNIIDLNQRFTKMKNEANQRKYTDENGEDWFEYAYKFSHDGKEYGYSIWALSLTHAEDLLKSMSKGVIIGEIHEIYGA